MHASQLLSNAMVCRRFSLSPPSPLTLVPSNLMCMPLQCCLGRQGSIPTITRKTNEQIHLGTDKAAGEGALSAGLVSRSIYLKTLGRGLQEENEQ